MPVALFQWVWNYVLLKKSGNVLRLILSTVIMFLSALNLECHREQEIKSHHSYTKRVTYEVKVRKIDYKIRSQKAYGHGIITKIEEPYSFLKGRRIYFYLTCPNIQLFPSQVLCMKSKIRILNPHRSESFFKYLCRKNIFLYGFGGNVSEIVGNGNRFQKKCHDFNNFLHNKIDYFSQKWGNYPSDKILYGLLLSEKKYLSRDQKNIFHQTSTAHLLAVSGLHIGFIALTLEWILRGLFLGKIRRMLILFTLLMYILVIGSPPSAVRAFIMLVCYWGACCVKRKPSGFSGFLFSAIIVLIYDPWMLWDIGFQLSYGVVAMLFLGTGPLNQCVKKIFKVNLFRDRTKIQSFSKKIFLSFNNLFSVAFTASLASAPLTFEYFGLWSLIGVLINPLVIQLATIIVPCGFLFCVISSLGIFENLASILFFTASRLLNLTEHILIWALKNFPWFQEYTLKIEGLGLALFLLFLTVSYVAFVFTFSAIENKKS